LRVAVVGGGIAGLAAAHRVIELTRERGLPLALTLFEAGPRLGGVIGTERVDGFLLEAGADSLISEKPWGLALAERLGLGDRLHGTDDRHRRTYVVRDRALHPLPEGFLLLAPTRIGPIVRSRLISWRGKARMALDLVLPRGPATGDESLGRFVRRRLGREALERIAAPLVAGIYTADPDRLSLEATMPRFLALERQHRSLILGLRRTAAARERQAAGARWSLFVTLAGGMGELVDALAARLPAGSVRLGTPVVALARGAAAPWILQLARGEAVAADAVVLAGEAHRMGPVVKEVDADLGRRLEEIPYAGSAAVALAYRRDAVGHPLDGFGFIVPRKERRAAIACTFASVKYPHRAPEGFVLLRVYLGGALDAAALSRDDAALAAIAHADVADLLRIAGPPVLSRVWRHPAAMPQYEVGHLARVDGIEARLAALPGLALAGAAYRGVGIADCVRSGEDAAARVVGQLAGTAP
jgi:oxygen-dependent protoporphyrinogen oxidase